jgi:hypothetical protein
MVIKDCDLYYLTKTAVFLNNDKLFKDKMHLRLLRERNLDANLKYPKGTQ